MSISVHGLIKDAGGATRVTKLRRESYANASPLPNPKDHIRELADAMLAKLKFEDPELFRDAGPGCVRGRCPEGSRSCGHPRGNLHEDLC